MVCNFSQVSTIHLKSSLKNIMIFLTLISGGGGGGPRLAKKGYVEGLGADHFSISHTYASLEYNASIFLQYTFCTQCTPVISTYGTSAASND